MKAVIEHKGDDTRETDFLCFKLEREAIGLSPEDRLNITSLPHLSLYIASKMGNISFSWKWRIRQ